VDHALAEQAELQSSNLCKKCSGEIHPSRRWSPLGKRRHSDTRRSFRLMILWWGPCSGLRRSDPTTWTSPGCWRHRKKFPGQESVTTWDAARAQADAAFYDIEETRLRLAEAAKLAFFDYFLVHREQEINAENVQSCRNSVISPKRNTSPIWSRNKTCWQAEVELADLERRQVELQRMHE